ncbi:MAG TPA: phosphate ABC transporter permease subunit PstC [Peptococcaceae bacterium]|nr:phosphate ABC transporter permease subunit PstC [Peptococcaceae bacterium]
MKSADFDQLNHRGEGRFPPLLLNFRTISRKIASATFFFCALFVVATVLSIVVMLGVKAVPFLNRVGVWTFLTGTEWKPLRGHFGIAPMIAGTAYVTLGALILGGPLGLGVAVFLAELAPSRIKEILNPLIDLLAGIPSVVYGFYGITVIVPWIRRIFGGPGFSVLAASVVLGVMILPTIVNVAREAIAAVPDDYREGSLALGASRWQTIFGVVLPAARSGIIAAIILGLGRAFGETMAVVMVAGNMVAFPKSILEPTRTLTSNVVLEMGYATGDHQAALFATGFVLLLFILTLNLASHWLTKKGVS